MTRLSRRIVPYKKMYVAEDYHQNYFNDNGNQPYCSFVIQPKVDKFEKSLRTSLKNNSKGQELFFQIL